MIKNSLFKSIHIGPVTIKNRFSMGAAIDHLDNDPATRIKRFGDLAKGGVGLIVSGATNLADDKTWRKVIHAVHENNCVFILQLIADKTPGILVSRLPENSQFFSPILSTLAYIPGHRAFTEDEIQSLISGYAMKAKKAKEIGADAVEIHGAHTSLPSQFLSPVTNKRRDKWGGSVENRVRFHGEILKAIRAACGPDFPVVLKLGVADPEIYAGGLTFEDGKKAAEILSECGYDAFEISQGLQEFTGCEPGGRCANTPIRTQIKTQDDEAFFKNWSKEIKELVSQPVILIGGLRSYEVISEIIEDGYADMAGLCRPFICEPNLINRWESGDHGKAKCISCNQCAFCGVKGEPLKCVFSNH